MSNLKIILTSWLYGFLYNIYFQKVEILYFSRLIIYQASLLFDKWSMHSFIYFINNASENVIRTFGIFATKFIFILFIIPILFEMDIFCPFILVIRPTSINYVNTMNATFTSLRERAWYWLIHNYQLSILHFAYFNFLVYIGNC